MAWIRYKCLQDSADSNSFKHEIVKTFEGTASVSEAAALLVSNGKLVVEKQKFPPDLTIAVARVNY